MIPRYMVLQERLARRIRTRSAPKALKHYRALVELLDDELGAAPAPETRELYERLRRGEDV